MLSRWLADLVPPRRKVSANKERRAARRRRKRGRAEMQMLEARRMLANVFWNVDGDGLWDNPANGRDETAASRLPAAALGSAKILFYEISAPEFPHHAIRLPRSSPTR